MRHTLTRSALTVTCFTALLTLMLGNFGTFDAQAAQVYKWVDENGVVTFGDPSQRPESTPGEAVKIDSYVPPAKPAATAEDEAKKDEQDKTKDKEKQAAAAPKMPAAEKRKLCAQARADLAAIQARGQVRVQDDKGNLTYLTDEQKQSRIKSINKSIQEYCR